MREENGITFGINLTETNREPSKPDHMSCCPSPEANSGLMNRKQIHSSLSRPTLLPKEKTRKDLSAVLVIKVEPMIFRCLATQLKGS